MPREQNENRISHYSFGSITVDGKPYSSDVIVFPDRVVSPWWRMEGHRIQPADLKDVVDSGTEVLIVGTGASGMMRVPAETLEFLRSRGISVKVEKTASAVELYNTGSKDRTVAAFHLTC